MPALLDVLGGNWGFKDRAGLFCAGRMILEELEGREKAVVLL